MWFISDTELIIEKIVCTGLRVGLQRHAKVFWPMGRKFLKRISIYCTKSNEIEIGHLDI